MRAVLGLGRVAQLAQGPSVSRARKPGHLAAYLRSRQRETRGRGMRQVASSSREEHDARQARYFAQALPFLQQSITPEVEQRLQAVADAAPGLGAASRVLDAGSGHGALIPHLQARGVSDILAVDVTPEMIAALEQRFGAPNMLGNEPCVRTWVGDIEDLPTYQGPFDAIFFNAVFGNLLDQHAALTKACFLLRPGGHLVVSHPLGRGWLEAYRSENPDIVPNSLPSEAEWRQLAADLPLRLLSFQDEEQLYLALLQVPEGYAHPRAPIRLAGAVTTGFGRGSKQLGVPTANLPPEPLAAELEGLPAGVYFGWARLEAGPGAPAADSQIHKMVMNVGKRPTFNDEDPHTTVELHIMHAFAEDFYGKQLKAVALGYIRPEMKFGSLGELLGRINTDIGIARSQLDQPQWAAYREDPSLH